jgi:ubiquinone/menaquinone biosynthesis C-methylase UbiE
MNKLKETIKDMFTKTYVNNLWFSESKSGLGSSLDYTINFRRELIEIIKKYEIKKIFDCSCGDWHWMKTIESSLPIYIGNDVVEDMIKDNTLKYGKNNIIFVCNDMLSQLKTYNDKEFDLIICRHTLEHLVTDYSIDVINEIKRVSKYALITSSKDSDKENGDLNMDGVSGRMVNLSKKPYLPYVGEPIYQFYDHKGDAKVEVLEASDGCFGYLYKF